MTSLLPRPFCSHRPVAAYPLLGRRQWRDRGAADPVVRALSHRLGHRRFLMRGYTLAVASTLMLMAATELWHFWVATLLLVAWCGNASVTSGLDTETLEPEAMRLGLPQLNAMNAFASILSFAAAG